MDYTKLPRYFIFKDKTEIDDFDIDPVTPQHQRVLESIGEGVGLKTMDTRLFEALQGDSFLVRLPGAPDYILEIFNAAHYITTLILMERHPMIYFSSYLSIADKVGAEPGYDHNTFHHIFCAMTMTLVTNYLQALNPRYLDLVKWRELLNVHFQNQLTSNERIAYSLNATSNLDAHALYALHGEQFFRKNLLEEQDAHALAAYPRHFLPRPIVEVVQESNFEDIYAHRKYIRACAEALPKVERHEALDIMGACIRSAAAERLQGAMPEAAEHIKQQMQQLAAELGFELNPAESAEAETATDADATRDDEIARLTEELETLKQKEKGLTAKQAALFGHALAVFCEFEQQKKEVHLSPMVHQLFGWGQRSVYNKMTEGYAAADREAVACIFETVWPAFADFVRNTFDKRH